MLGAGDSTRPRRAGTACGDGRAWEGQAEEEEDEGEGEEGRMGRQLLAVYRHERRWAFMQP